MYSAPTDRGSVDSTDAGSRRLWYRVDGRPARGRGRGTCTARCGPALPGGRTDQCGNDPQSLEMRGFKYVYMYESMQEGAGLISATSTHIDF